MLQVAHERNFIGVQLVRRNDELSLLYEKMKILEMTLHKGERQYNERLEDIRLLKLEIRNVRCRNNMLEKNNQAVNDLRLIFKHISSYSAVHAQSSRSAFRLLCKRFYY